jgi:RNA polymerase sigma-70 factor (ECF subfamily)
MKELQVEARFNSLLKQYGKVLRNAIAYHCPDYMGLDCDDIVQEACLRLWRAVAGEREIHDPASYLRRIAATATIDAIRRVKARREEQMNTPPAQDSESEPEATLLSPGHSSPESVAQHQELIAVVQTMLGRLSENRQRAVRLHLQGLNTEEIAEILGWSEPKARNLVYRGLEELRSQLRACGIDYEVE